MDIFIEKMVKRKKEGIDYIIQAMIIAAAAVLIIFLLAFIPGIGPFIAAAVLYGAYILVKAQYVEFEYSVTSGELDIDRITGKRRRKRIFSANCKDFEVLAKLNSDKYDQSVKTIKNRIAAVSSMQSEDVYFAFLHYNGNRTVVFFEPDKRMLDAFRSYIPRKVFE